MGVFRYPLVPGLFRNVAPHFPIADLISKKCTFLQTTVCKMHKAEFFSA
jgi:hypothetical protein